MRHRCVVNRSNSHLLLWLSEGCGRGIASGHGDGDVDDIDDINDFGVLTNAVPVCSVRGWRAEHTTGEKTQEEGG